MDPQEYHIMAAVEETHPWFVNRRRLVADVARRLLGHRAAGKQLRVLDAGSGTGGNLASYSEFGWVIGIEYDRQAAAIGQSRGDFRQVVGDLARLPVRSGCFDLVLCTDVIEHLADDLAALRELRRAVASGGYLILTTPAYALAYTDHDRHLQHVRRYDAGDLDQRFRRAGLRIVHRARYNVLLAVPVLLARIGSRNGSDVGRPIAGFARSLLDRLWRLEAALAARMNLGVGLTHLVVLSPERR